MASLTAATFLMSGGDASTAYSKLVDISEYRPSILRTLRHCPMPATSTSMLCRIRVDLLSSPAS